MGNKRESIALDIQDMIQLTGELVINRVFESPEQLFIQLSRDITRHVDLQKNLQWNLLSARKMLQDLRAQRKEMEKTRDIHMQYLENVERQAMLTDEMKSEIKNLKLPDKEFTHKELEEKRIIIESRLPVEVRKRVKFVISTNDCSVFLVRAKFKSIEAFSVELTMKDLLCKQENNEFELEIAGEVVLNVNLLMHMLNTHFLAKSEKIRMKMKPQGSGKSAD
jgi:hypothetical protein